MAGKFLLLYGTTDGQAKSIAEIILDRCDNYKSLQPEIHCMDKVGTKFDLTKETVAVFVCATTGDGDPPDNAQKLVRQLKSKSLPSDHLSQLNFAVLGLGDTNYSTFCGGPRQLDKALRALGAKEMCPSGWADDAVGLEIVVDPWLDNLFPTLEKFFNERVLCNGDSQNNNPAPAIVENLEIPKSLLCDSCDTELSKCEVDGDLASALQSINFSQPTRKELLGDDAAHLDTVDLSVPQLSPAFLKMHLDSEGSTQMLPHHALSSIDLPLGKDKLTPVKIVSLIKLTSDDAGKISYKAIFDFGTNPIPLRPGDSISLLCQNDPFEVETLLKRLKVSDRDFNSCRVNLSILSDTSKKRAAIPEHLACCTGQPVSLYRVFLECVDIRQVASKALLRMLAEYCSVDNEKRILFKLSSRQGQTLFTKYTRESQLSLLDLLQWLPSCHPPIPRLLELLPRLQPRPYSVANLPKCNTQFSVVFNLVEIPQSDLRLYPRLGVATGMMHRHWLSNQTSALRDSPQFFVYLRKNISLFSPPDDPSLPMILVGPGTGCAPFIGFLEDRERKLTVEVDKTFSEIWLFHGCRYRNKDELFKEDLTNFRSQNVLGHLCLCYSREKRSDDSMLCHPEAVYVQDCIAHHSDAIAELVVKKEARIYVCGDAKGMAKDVSATLIDILTGYEGMSAGDAHDFIIKLRVEKRYVEDVWT